MEKCKLFHFASGVILEYSLAPCVAGSAKRHVLGRHFPTLQRPQSPNGDSEAPPNAESSTIGQNAVENWLVLSGGCAVTIEAALEFAAQHGSRCVVSS